MREKINWKSIVVGLGSPISKGRGGTVSRSGRFARFRKYWGSCEICGNLGILRSGDGLAVPCVAGFRKDFSPAAFPAMGNFPTRLWAF